MYESYIELANAIIIQAVKDYRIALRKIRNNIKDILAHRDKKNIEQFFGSEWFSMLTKLDPELLLKKLEGEN